MAVPSNSVLETFTGANGTSPPNADWTNGCLNGNSGLAIQSNQAAKVAGSGSAYWNAATYLEAEAFATLTALAASGGNSGFLILRLQSPGTASAACYAVGRETNTQLAIFRVLNGSGGSGFTRLAAATYTCVAGDQLVAQVSGSGGTVTINLWVNGSLKATYADTSASRITSAGRIGLYEEDSAARWDNWGGGTIATGISQAIGAAGETDAARALGRAKTRAIGFPAEGDAARPLTPGKSRAIGFPAEADAAQPLGRAKARALGRPGEVDAARPLERAKARAIAAASEAEAALPLVVVKSRPLGIAFEDDVVPAALSRAKARALEPALETDRALGLSAPPGEDAETTPHRALLLIGS